MKESMKLNQSVHPLLCGKGGSSRTFREPSSASTFASSKDFAGEDPTCEDPTCEETERVDDGFEEADVIKRIEHLTTGSSLPPTDWEYPTFSRNELVLRKCLGKGAFSSVEEISAVVFAPVRRFRSSKTSGDTNAFDNRESRNFIAENCIRSTGQPRYAMKALRADVAADPGKRWIAIADLLIETHFLRHLEHPNIIKLRGVASSNPQSSEYFLVLDRLYCTLEVQLMKWKSTQKRNDSPVGFVVDPRRKVRKNLWKERIVAAFHLSAALEYLHEKKIIHRDIKPQNIGFDVRGDIKIFDFGLARELVDRDSNGDGTYNLSHMTGSLRYMAPEVYFQNSPYNESCDVYSFAILLWQMLALECPYNDCSTEDEFVKQVFRGGSRPPLAKITSKSCSIMLVRAWNENFKSRPRIDAVSKLLRKEAMTQEFGEANNFDFNRRRSTFVFRGNKSAAKR